MSDYIKREDALNASKIVYIEYIAVDDEGYEDGDADDIPCVFKADIEKIPAADVRENVHGRWRGDGMGDLRHRGREAVLRLHESGSRIALS